MAFDTSQFREFRYGWPVVLASTFGISLGMSPLPFYTIGVFAQPLAKEFGWGIDQIMLGLGLVGGILAGVAKFMFAYDLVEKEDTCPLHTAD